MNIIDVMAHCPLNGGHSKDITAMIGIVDRRIYVSILGMVDLEMIFFSCFIDDADALMINADWL